MVAIILSIIGGVVGITIDICFAVQFSNVAKSKGYENSKYFVLCLLFGVPGWILVASLPDQTIKAELNKVTHSMQAVNSTLSSVDRNLSGLTSKENNAGAQQKQQSQSESAPTEVVQYDEQPNYSELDSIDTRYESADLRFY